MSGRMPDGDFCLSQALGYILRTTYQEYAHVRVSNGDQSPT
ncbi:hypothetical protein THF1C08_80037 [Vibrio jasicida]|uniref:Uncharacterized protein n=1 Tax=Vibrio jasicida TaxID=766224 RepID=A0AAU9QYI6_9VIBR|nr:hypothetical protein THF1C08_80037 [Vibrio jasicida]CAH1603317.1 hypothetical protein THF1A12_70036 [Vibrio jasicida]